MDAKYRFGNGESENDNAAETRFYNAVDRLAEQTGAAIVMIHHSSKGSQSDKRVTDVGSGAGAQSRAADCHMVLREHEDDGVVVLDAVVRSFPPVEPVALKWEYPLWHLTEADTSLLKGKKTNQEQRQNEKDKEGTEQIIDAIRKEGPGTARVLRERTGISRERQQRLLDWLVSQKQLSTTKTTVRGNECNVYQLAQDTEF
ncbi:AAA family ATPase [Bythopirellula polymerisocia]|uniref:Uncharacterized protein n=1 Tax=Bythopirellula polymerisocia TaxID=2528003 RepID=A0A5C6C2Z4_9BACT|nr:AAA family ATPase [Bythopirellula polymerisocia]TWU17624.1 hypothetical protein Pla144_50940 [Bythopirellula polymerisocia]